MEWENEGRGPQVKRQVDSNNPGPGETEWRRPHQGCKKEQRSKNNQEEKAQNPAGSAKHGEVEPWRPHLARKPARGEQKVQTDGHKRLGESRQLTRQVPAKRRKVPNKAPVGSCSTRAPEGDSRTSSVGTKQHIRDPLEGMKSPRRRHVGSVTEVEGALPKQSRREAARQGLKEAKAEQVKEARTKQPTYRLRTGQQEQHSDAQRTTSKIQPLRTATNRGHRVEAVERNTEQQADQ